MSASFIHAKTIGVLASFAIVACTPNVSKDPSKVYVLHGENEGRHEEPAADPKAIATASSCVKELLQKMKTDIRYVSSDGRVILLEKALMVAEEECKLDGIASAQSSSASK